MKNNIFIISLFSLLLVSCGKDNKNAPKASIITATIDGVDYTFNVNAKARHLTIEGAPAVHITGRQNDLDNTHVGLIVAYSNGVQARNYDENNTVQLGMAQVNYYDGQRGAPYISNHSVSNPAAAVIFEVTETSINGSFSGDVFLMENGGYSPTTKKTITKGFFRVNF